MKIEKMRLGKAVCTIGGLGILAHASLAWGQYSSEIVAYSGQPIDALRVFELFDDPAINDDGNVVFWAWDSIDTSSNDECSGAIDVTLGTTTVGNHYATPTETPTWCGTNDVWLRFTATSSTQHTLHGFLCVGTTNQVPAIAIYSGSCGNLTQIQANCFNTQTQFNAVEGTTYYFRLGARTTVGSPERITATIDLRNTAPGSSHATPRSNQRGVWLRPASGELELVVHEGMVTPFDAERTFRSSYFPALGPGDDIALLAATRGSSTTSEITRASLVRSTGGVMEELLRDRPQPEFPLWQTPLPQLNATGRLAYALNDGSELRYGDSVVTAGQQAPGTPKGVTFQLIDQPVSSPGTPVVFRARLQGTGVDEPNNIGLWIDLGSGPQLLARTGSPAPGAGPGVVWRDLAIEPAVSENGVVAFHGTLTGLGVTGDNNAGIWMGTPGNLQLVARTSDEVPGVAGAFFLSLNRQVRINQSGMGVIGATIVGEGVDTSSNTGLWTIVAEAGASLLAREGQAASESIPDAVLDTFFDPVLDNDGNVLVTARIRGGKVGSANNEVLLVARGSERRVVARSGDSVELPSMESKTVRRVVFGDWGGGSNGRSVTNSRGEIVYRLVFTDGTEAISLATDRCAADWNADGVVNSNDFFTFLIDFFNGQSDINGDGVTNSQDFFDFLAIFFNGCA